jgi:4-aminobutyrate aminotransferase-like enzyme/Ser/Thr protein kinase RdoA (MazF antagonist)
VAILRLGASEATIGRTAVPPFTISHMMPESRVVPPVSRLEAERIAKELYLLDSDLKRLPGEYDDNFHLATSEDREFVLKIMHPGREESFVDMQCRALLHLAERAPHLVLPRVQPTASGDSYCHMDLEDGSQRLVWMLTFLPGTVLAKSLPHTDGLLKSLGALLGEMDSALLDFSHPASKRPLKWELGISLWARHFLDHVKSPHRRALAARFLNLFESEAMPRFARLRRSVIYGDANDYNALVDANTAGRREVVSVIDFGDMHTGLTVAEPAVAAAYAILGKDDALSAASAVLAGYHRAFPLTSEEISVFFPLLAARLAVSVVNSAHRQGLVPDDPYVTVTEEHAWEALERLNKMDPRAANEEFQVACTTTIAEQQLGTKYEMETSAGIEETLAERRRLLGANLSVSYEKPLKIVRGRGQYLYDGAGRPYLDVYNNVPLVGHSHPRVVAAVQNQIALLNTNTRYLHDNILRYADRLTMLLPKPLEVCYFVNSGTEANDLALRLARAHTGREDVIVQEHAYHGHSQTLIDISPYKFNGPGGSGKKSWVHVVPMADDYRGLYRRGEPEIGRKFSEHVAQALEECQQQGRSVAAFIAETLPSVAGQIVFPEGYLTNAYKHVRAARGICIADEVQVGFGRLGTHFWGFETQEVVPDIVVLGKPIGNAFPLAAVVTSRAIADSFANGMEYFSTYGGNPVACAAGLAVLDVVEEQKLQANALKAGEYWLRALRGLQNEFALIGDIRGSGLFLGIDLVNSRESREPATAQASYLVNQLREMGILAGTDGPGHNVIKLRPPLIFSEENADFFTTTFAKVLLEAGAQPAK